MPAVSTKQVGLVLPLHQGVNGVAGGSGNRGDDRSLLAHQAIQHRRLPHVGAADQGHADGAIRFVRILDLRCVDHLADQIEEIADALVVLRGDRERLAETEAGEFVGLTAGCLGLVDDEEHLLARATDLAGQSLVIRQQAVLSVDQQDHQGGLPDGHVGLDLAEFQEMFIGPGRKAPGVDDRKLLALPLDAAIRPITGRAGLGIDDGLPTSGEAIEKSGLTNVGPTDEGDERAGVGFGWGFGVHMVYPNCRRRYGPFTPSREPHRLRTALFAAPFALRKSDEPHQGRSH
jgi:hypothetical protein